MLTDIYGDEAKPVEWRWLFRGASTNADAKD